MKIMTKLNKTENAVEQCPTCKQKMICRMTKGSDKYPAKLQWQNDDGKAHYSFDFATKTTSCKDEVLEPTATNTTSVITIPMAEGIEAQVLQRIYDDAKAVTKHNIARLAGVMDECKNSNITHPATIGMLFNAAKGELPR